MQHLDEGTLHAYLDGALTGGSGVTPESQNVEQHLSVCVECQGKLEAARLLRDDAAKVLAGAGPVNVAMPSFEELQSRARSRGGEGQHRRLHRMKSLAWAATIVLAAAVGWLARSAILPTRPASHASEDEASGRLMIQVPELETSDADTIDDPDRPLAQGGDHEQNLTDTQLDEPQNERDVPGLVGVIATPVEREATVIAERAAVSAVAGGEGRQAPPEVQDMSRARQQVDAGGVAAAPSVTRAIAARFADEGSVWKIVDEATAAAILEAPVPAIDGLPIVAYETSTFNGRQAVRVQQSLESGQLLDLVITVGFDVEQSSTAKKGVESLNALAGALEESVNSVVVQRGSLNIRLSAALAVDSLHALAELVASGR